MRKAQKEHDQFAISQREQPPATAPSLPEFNNFSPGGANPAVAGDLGQAVEHDKLAPTPATNPSDQPEIAPRIALESLNKQQVASARYFRAKMTREDAQALCEMLSQPTRREVAQAVSPESRRLEIQSKTESPRG